MDNSLGEKIKSYFSDRMEEIKDGTYIPYYERIKNMPEFKGINYDTFIIARDEWYLHHFHTPFDKISSRDIDTKKHNYRLGNGICFSIIGVILIYYALSVGMVTGWNPSYGGGYFIYVYMLGVPGMILLVIGIVSIIRYYT